MMEMFDLKEKLEFLNEVMELELYEWTNKVIIEKDKEIQKKINKYYEYIDDKYFCKLILVDNNRLIGFISLFPHESILEPDLFPWYSTMYVKKEYRGRGYSKILNDAILNETKNRGIRNLYLKTTLNNYYEKFGAKFVKNLDNGEKILKFEI